MVESSFNDTDVIDYLHTEHKIMKNSDLIKIINNLNNLDTHNVILSNALLHGTSIGGARPKSSVERNNKKYIAKFSTNSDLFPVKKCEFFAMSLAKEVGINVADSILLTDIEYSNKSDKNILLIERFDRVPYIDTKDNQVHFKRKSMVSGLTVMLLDEMTARYSSYLDLVQMSKIKNKDELFKRMAYNIGNTDDHARNHAFFYDGKGNLELTPAYDISPMPRKQNEMSQAMKINHQSSLSNFQNCLAEETLNAFDMTKDNAIYIIDEMVKTIKEQYEYYCDQAELNTDLLKNSTLNESVFYGYISDKKPVNKSIYKR